MNFSMLKVCCWGLVITGVINAGNDLLLKIRTSCYLQVMKANDCVLLLGINPVKGFVFYF
jgi:hypothetical protein